jgi:hypothetical protein
MKQISRWTLARTIQFNTCIETTRFSRWTIACWPKRPCSSIPKYLCKRVGWKQLQLNTNYVCWACTNECWVLWLLLNEHSIHHLQRRTSSMTHSRAKISGDGAHVLPMARGWLWGMIKQRALLVRRLARAGSGRQILAPTVGTQSVNCTVSDSSYHTVNSFRGLKWPYL